jgi:hypothetical protein
MYVVWALGMQIARSPLLFAADDFFGKSDSSRCDGKRGGLLHSECAADDLAGNMAVSENMNGELTDALAFQSTGASTSGRAEYRKWPVARAPGGQK